MKTLITLLITITVSIFVHAQEKVSMSDFQNLHNTHWTGELMYINYSDGKEVTLATTLEINIKKNNIIFFTKYPNEKSANGKSSLQLRKNGSYIGDQKIINVQRFENKSMQIVTMYEGKDANREATIYITYFFSTTKMSMQKEVVFKDTQEKLVRNRYTYTKA